MDKCQTIEKMLQMSSEDRAKASKVVARSFYKMLRRNGFSQSEIMTFAGHLLDGVIRDMKVNGKDKEGAVDLRNIRSQKESQEVA